jgi:RecA/RadA recombinase
VGLTHTYGDADQPSPRLGLDGSSVPTTLSRMLTGIPEFDALLDRGLPRSRTTRILGGPDAGKTLLIEHVRATLGMVNA